MTLHHATRLAAPGLLLSVLLLCGCDGGPADVADRPVRETIPVESAGDTPTTPALASDRLPATEASLAAIELLVDRTVTRLPAPQSVDDVADTPAEAVDPTTEAYLTGYPGRAPDNEGS